MNRLCRSKEIDLKQMPKWKSEIGWFWNILFSLSRNEKAAFLQFVTGSSKVPLAGFAVLQGMRANKAEIGFEGFANLETRSPSKNVEADMRRNFSFVRRLMKES